MSSRVFEMRMFLGVVASGKLRWILPVFFLWGILAGQICRAAAGAPEDIAPPSTPVISPGTGTYTAPQAITISDATAGASIHYTTDGSLPNASSEVYTEPITVSRSTMVRAVALVPGAAPSGTVTAVLNFAQMWPVVAFGDSVTSGHIGSPIDYPSQLALITGQPSFDNGIGGQASGQIAVRLNAYAGTERQTIASELTIPTSGVSEIRFPSGYEPCYRAEANRVLVTIQGNPSVTGYCADDGTGTLWFAPLAYPDTPFTISAGTPWVAELGNQPYHCVGIEEGQVNFPDSEAVLNDIAATVAAVRRTTSCYFVLSILNSSYPGGWRGSENYNEVTAINSSIADTYGSHFIDMESRLVASYDPSNPNDLLDFQNDVPPYSLHASAISGALTSDLPNTTSCAFTTATSPPDARFQRADILTIGNEEILILGAVENTVSNCLRGFAGTQAAAHPVGSAFTDVEANHPGQNSTSAHNPNCSNGYICVAEQIYQWMVLNSPHTTAKASMLSPTAGAVLPGPTATFTWSPGEAVLFYAMSVGTTGPGSHDVYTSVAMNSLSLTVPHIPTYGAPLYVRLYSKINGVWQYTDYVYTEATN